MKILNIFCILSVVIISDVMDIYGMDKAVFGIESTGLKNVLYEVNDRCAFRRWLLDHHDKERECWIFVKRGIPENDTTFWYLDAVEEALCFGWIDSIHKNVTGIGHIQKMTPRRKKSFWSELNKERCRRLEKLGLMTPVGRAVLPDMSERGFIIDSDILRALRSDSQTWEIFQKFPPLYQRVRVDTVQREKKNKATYERMLEKLLKNTKQNIMFGEWNDHGRLLQY